MSGALTHHMVDDVDDEIRQQVIASLPDQNRKFISEADRAFAAAIDQYIQTLEMTGNGKMAEEDFFTAFRRYQDGRK